nr:hypothetical protein Iba_chr05aCG4970 [Ipomoea batatas]
MPSRLNLFTKAIPPSGVAKHSIETSPLSHSSGITSQPGIGTSPCGVSATDSKPSSGGKSVSIVDDDPSTASASDSVNNPSETLDFLVLHSSKSSSSEYR